MESIDRYQTGDVSKNRQLTGRRVTSAGRRELILLDGESRPTSIAPKPVYIGRLTQLRA